MNGLIECLVAYLPGPAALLVVMFVSARVSMRRAGTQNMRSFDATAPKAGIGQILVSVFCGAAVAVFELAQARRLHASSFLVFNSLVQFPISFLAVLWLAPLLDNKKPAASAKWFSTAIIVPFTVAALVASIRFHSSGCFNRAVQ